MSGVELTWILYGDLISSLRDDTTALRALFTLADDSEGLAELARTNMGQSSQIMTDR